MAPSSLQNRWNFGVPLGEQVVVEVPFAETILISRHVKAAAALEKEEVAGRTAVSG
jgi:hypothetical protein